MAIFEVATAAELDAALAAANSGDTIELAPGNYGDLSVRLLTFDSPVTIISADPTKPAEFDGIHVWESSFVTFDNIVIDMPVTKDTTMLDEGVSIYASSNITIQNSQIVGGDAIGGIDPSAPAGSQGLEGVNGYSIGRAVEIGQSQDIFIINNDISEFDSGVSAVYVEGLVIEGNDFFDTRSSQIVGRTVSDVTIHDNHFSDVNSWKYGGVGDHSDYIHIYTSDGQDAPNENITITDNFFEQGDGLAIMSIYFSGHGDEAYSRNILIDGNVFHTSEPNTMRLGWVEDTYVTNNTLISSTDQEGDGPGITLSKEVENIYISDNVLAGVVGNILDEAVLRNIVVNNNLEVQSVNPLLDNYVGDLFVNPLATSPSLDDLTAIPGGAADGLGSHLTQFEIAPETPDGYILGDRSDGLMMNVHTFSVEAFLDGVDLSDLSDATVTWTFGDGGTATGETVTHAFEASGLTSVKAVITFPDNEELVLDTVVNVLTPIAVAADFERGAKDLSDFLTPHEKTGDAKLVDGVDGRVMHLYDSDARLSYESTPEMRDNPEFTLSLGVKKTEGSLDDTGFAAYYSGTAVIKIGPDSVQVSGQTDEGDTYVLEGEDLPIRDTDWHQITMTYSEPDGTATLYVDGELMDEVTGLSGGQHVTRGHDLHIGGRSGNSLEASYDNVLFLRGALDAEGVKSLFENSEWTEITDIPDLTEKPGPVDGGDPGDETSGETGGGTDGGGTSPKDPGTTDPKDGGGTTDGKDTGDADPDTKLSEAPEDDDGGLGFFRIFTVIFDIIRAIFGGGSSGNSSPTEATADSESAKVAPGSNLDEVIPVTPDSNNYWGDKAQTEADDDDLNDAF